MIHSDQNSRGGKVLRFGYTHAVLALLTLTVSGCDLDSLIQIQDPDLITLPVVQDTAVLPQIRNGVLFEFARAYSGEPSNASGADPGQIVQSALLSDEMWAASTFTTHHEIDRRRIDLTNGTLLGGFRYLQRARNLAETASALFEASPRAGSPDHALVINLAGFTYILFAENYCSGVPFSQQPFTGEAVFGEQQSTEQILNLAIARFDEALGVAGTANDAQQRDLALLGKARALLDLGRFAEAGQAAAQVPSDFLFNVEYGERETSQNNAVYFFNKQAQRVSAASGEGINGLRFFNRGNTNVQIDPRVPVDSLGFGSGRELPLYEQLAYPSRGAPIPLASGIEANLIEAEALLDKGQSAAYLPILNTLRAEAGLAALTDPGTPAGRVDQLFQERAFWLWLTSHRLGDMRRLVRQYGRDANTVFPIGVTIDGDPYGPDLNLPIPSDEANNPNFEQCLNRDA